VLTGTVVELDDRRLMLAQVFAHLPVAILEPA
jgi:hypothetical protein